MLDSLTRRDALLDMLLADKEELLKDVKAEGCTGRSSHEIVEFRILREVSKTNRITALHFRRAVFSLFRYLLGRISWETALEGNGAKERWIIFKDSLLRAEVVSYDMEEVEQTWQKASVDERGTHD